MSEGGRGSQLLAAVVLSACIGVAGGAASAYAVYQRLGPVQQRIVNPSAAGGGGSTAAIGTIAGAAGASLVKIRTHDLGPAGLGDAAPPLVDGFVASSDGLIVTSANAVSGAGLLRVGLSDGRGFDAGIAGTDIADGIAVLHLVGAHDLAPIRFAGGDPRPGDAAIVVAAPPLGSFTTTVGTVKATGQRVQPARASLPVARNALVADMLPDAYADGAPMLDAGGAVIGVVVNPAAGSPPGTLALSGRAAAVLVNALRRGDATPPATFGVDWVLVDGAAAASSGVAAGALIRSVTSGGPAAVAGLLPGDVVTAVDGITLDAGHQLEPTAFGLEAGQAATLTVVRGGHTLSLAVVLGR